MKMLLAYWVIGCIVVGPAIGSNMNDCPQAKVLWPDMVAAVAIWPGVLAAAIALKPGPKTSCTAEVMP